MDNLELFVTDEMRFEILENQKPWQSCDMCNDKGINQKTNDTCDCIRKAYRMQILGIPARYNVKFEMSKQLQKLIENSKKYHFIKILGDMRYVKIVGYYLARQAAEEGAIAVCVMSRSKIDVEFDFSKINKSDLLLFEDITQKFSDMNYKVNLIKRIDNNKPIIFLGEQHIIEESDDFYDMDVDVTDITILE